MSTPIFVNKPFMPERAILNKYIDEIYATHHLTNFGPLHERLTERLCERFGVENLLLVSNGTLALQLLYRALDIKAAVTTPFSFAATLTSLVYERVGHIYADIDSRSLCLDPSAVESTLKSDVESKLDSTKVVLDAIIPVSVYGIAPDVEKLDTLGQKYNAKVIYDLAHAFDIALKDGSSMLHAGSASTLSFHATKLFHTIEGGAIVSKDAGLIAYLKDFINFSLKASAKGKKTFGTNAKLTEFAAAMGLAMLECMDFVYERREEICSLYDTRLRGAFERPEFPQNIEKTSPFATPSNRAQNFHYYPIICQSEGELLDIVAALESENIYPRRYFYPSLDEYYPATLQEAQSKIDSKNELKIAHDISRRILCLPLYVDLDIKDVERIADICLRSKNADK